VIRKKKLTRINIIDLLFQFNGRINLQHYWYGNLIRYAIVTLYLLLYIGLIYHKDGNFEGFMLFFPIFYLVIPF